MEHSSYLSKIKYTILFVILLTFTYNSYSQSLENMSSADRYFYDNYLNKNIKFPMEMIDNYISDDGKVLTIEIGDKSLDITYCEYNFLMDGDNSPSMWQQPQHPYSLKLLKDNPDYLVVLSTKTNRKYMITIVKNNETSIYFPHSDGNNIVRMVEIGGKYSKIFKHLGNCVD